METPAFDIEHVVPHRGPMCLLDRVLECSGDDISAEVEIRADALFAGPEGVPAWVGIEYMAQAVAAWAGCRARAAGREPAIGFLLGSRRYEAFQPHFAIGRTLRVEAHREVLGDNGLGAFACRIVCAGQVLASATISVFEPPDPVAFLENEAG